SYRRGRPSQHLKLPELSSDHRSPPADSFRLQVDPDQARWRMISEVQRRCSSPSRLLAGGYSQPEHGPRPSEPRAVTQSHRGKVISARLFFEATQLLGATRA